jgi:hypothetical protein
MAKEDDRRFISQCSRRNNIYTVDKTAAGGLFGRVTCFLVLFLVLFLLHVDAMLSREQKRLLPSTFHQSGINFSTSMYDMILSFPKTRRASLARNKIHLFSGFVSPMRRTLRTSGLAKTGHWETPIEGLNERQG